MQFIVNDDLPEAAQAASYALAIIRIAGVDSWDDLGGAELTPARQAKLDDLDISPEQKQIMLDHPEAVHLVRKGPPMRSIAVCDTCGFTIAVCGPSSKKCVRPRGCSGAMVRATTAARA